MLSNRVHDESRSFDRTGSVSVRIDGSLGDHITLVEFTRLSPDFAARIGSDDGVGEMPGRAHVEFDLPLAMTFPEVERMSVDFSAPLLRGHPAMASHGDAFLSGQPGDEFSLGDPLSRLDLEAFRGCPEGVALADPLVPSSAPVLGGP
ncbi:hypothetical protein PP713_03160 [Mycobacterium sp. CSUR Q5927]|nr:hypothetical protein [Mycobacterium sp. CSUR Q5927]